MSPILYTFGHSDRRPDELLGLLVSAGIECLIDIRRYPVSRRYPYYARESLQACVESAGMRYRWEGAALGGRRAASDDTPHTGLDDVSLRGFAGYMEGGQFTRHLQAIILTATRERTVLMCAERLPEHCHRSLVADYLLWQGCRVIHLLGAGMAREHRMHPCVRVLDSRLIYNRDMTIPLDLR